MHIDKDKPYITLQKEPYPISLQKRHTLLEKNPRMHEDEDGVVTHVGMHDDQMW